MAQRAGEVHPAFGDVDAAVAIREETAAAMGRAGRRLQEAVARYRETIDVADRSSIEEQALLDEVTRCTWRLLVQRECAGARTRNLETIAAAYDVPPAALRGL